MFITDVEELDPLLLYAVKVTEYAPEAGKQILVDVVLVGLAIVAPAGLASQRTLSTVPMLVLVNVMQLSWQAVDDADVKEATGVLTTLDAVESRIWSTANAGSLPDAVCLKRNAN